MLRPRSDTTLPSTQALALPAELPTWNPLTPMEELPLKLQQLRQAQQQLNRMIADAEGQVLHFLRKGALVERQHVVKKLIGRFYPFTTSLLEEHYAKLTASGILANACTVELASEIRQFDKSFKLDWSGISDASPYLRKLMGRFHYKISLGHAAANISVGWDEELIRRYAIDDESFFTNLSLTNGVQWHETIIRSFFDRWVYTTDGLLDNPYLPWDDDSLPALLSELNAAKYEAENEEELSEDETEAYLIEAKAAATKMKRRYWQRHSADRFREWTVDYLRQNADKFDWQELSANPALPFSFALLIEFEEQWNWDALALNYGLYRKALQPLLSNTIVDEFLTLYKD